MVLSLMSILIIILFLSFGIMVISPKDGLYLYKGAVFIIMLIVLFVAIFFYLEGNSDISALNINLHPWQNYLLYPVIVTVFCVTVIFAISQLPLLFVRYHNKKRMVKYEGIVYAVVLIIEIICLSENCGIRKLNDAKLQVGNDVVRLIDEYARAAG